MITSQGEVSLGKMTKEETALKILDEILKSNKLIWRQNQKFCANRYCISKENDNKEAIMNQTSNRTQTAGSSVRTRNMVQTAIFGVVSL